MYVCRTLVAVAVVVVKTCTIYIHAKDVRCM